MRNFEYIKTNGITLRVVVEGTGPLCVLVHGFPESWYSYRHMIDPLINAGYRVAIPDVRGYGGSDKPYEVEAYDLEHLTDDISGLITALGEKQAILIGHDWGAPIVYHAALRFPEMVKAVVGMSVPYLGRGEHPPLELFKYLFKDRFFYITYFQAEGVAEKELETDLKSSLIKFYTLISAEGVLNTKYSEKGPDATFLEGIDMPKKLPNWLSEEDINYYVEQFKQSGFRGPINRYRNLDRDFHMNPQFASSKITQPALFIVGTFDPVPRMIPGVNQMDIMDAYYTDLRGKVLIEGAGHWTQQEKPNEVNAAVLSFLKTL